MNQPTTKYSGSKRGPGHHRRHGGRGGDGSSIDGTGAWLTGKQRPQPNQPAGPQSSPAPSGQAHLRIIPLGGQEEVGRNMTVFEYGNDIIILDMGLQFPEEDMPGVDYIIPDVRYLKGKEKRIRGVILSHGHLDHIGALPHLLPQLGWPTVYASKLTMALVRRRLEESKLTRYLKAYEIKSEHEQFTFGKLRVSLFNVTHSIMDAFGIVIHTPVGNVIHLGDWKYDLNPVNGKPTDFSHLARWNTRQAPSLLMMESLGSTKEGSQLSEVEVYRNLKAIIEKAPARIIVATFSSMVERVAQIIDIAENLGKKIALDGYSMKMNIEIAKKIGYVKFKPTTLIDVRRLHDYPPNKVIVICTGAQGEDRAVLMRIASGVHKHIKVEKSDTIVFSSSVIPGNERSIQRVKDSLYRQGANVIHKEIMDVHGGGHALIEDIKLLIRQVKPKYLVPVYANHYLLREGGKVAQSVGMPPQNIFYLDNGSVLELLSKGPQVSKEKVPIEYVFVDGLGVGDVSHVVIRDRQILSADGMFVIVATVDGKTGKLVASPDIISRGFVYMRDSKKLIDETRAKIKQLLGSQSKQQIADEAYLKDKIRNEVGQFLFQRTERRPMILPIVITV